MSSNKTISALIIDFLNTVIEKKEVQEEFADSLNVAIDCIAEAFEIEREDVKSLTGGKTLAQLASGATAATGSSAASSLKVEVKVEDDPKAKAEAETLKLEGNKAMASRDFALAISKYTAAIEAYPSNPIYYANRAAASSSLKDYESAVADAELAIKIDPNYSKGYSRLGFAKYALDEPQEALEAYAKVLEIEGDKATAAMKKDYDTAKTKVESTLNLEKTEREATPGSASGSNPFGGAGGMPDMSSFMNGAGLGGLGGMLNNPQVMEAAQNMMKNPGMMQEMMNNPAIKQMAEKFSGGNGMPDLGSLMSDPSIKDMASKMFGPK